MQLSQCPRGQGWHFLSIDIIDETFKTRTSQQNVQRDTTSPRILSSSTLPHVPNHNRQLPLLPHPFPPPILIHDTTARKSKESPHTRTRSFALLGIRINQHLQPSPPKKGNSNQMKPETKRNAPHAPGPSSPDTASPPPRHP